MWEITVRGVVQGVGFRPTVKRTAVENDIRGFVKNHGSHVTIGIEGDPRSFMDEVKIRLGPIARIEEYSVREKDWSEFGFKDSGPDDFTILGSESGARDSSLPPDTAICDSCLSEMMNPEDRRFLHPFTNCTNCGARYTLIRSLPYDRERTSMDAFPPCGECSREYSDQAYRRFHAQTLSCPDDGPLYRYLDRDLNEIASGYDAVMKTAGEIIRGKKLIVKGWGGMHIVCDPAILGDMRIWYGRPYKPFALMVPDIESAGKLAKVSGNDEKTLLSPARPITLLPKVEDPDKDTEMILEGASPGLSTIGIYLPYSGINHLLFRALSELGSPMGSLVMTSANPPGEPMALDLASASLLNADGYLDHNREIVARSDDSVIVPFDFKLHGMKNERLFGVSGFPIRKSRGLIPDPVEAYHDRRILALGAERNVNVSVSRNGRIFTSPYIGNTRHPSVIDYEHESAERMMDLFGADDPEAVVVDAHPRYATRSLGVEFSERYDIPVIEVQHHHAHCASLLIDNDLERSACLAFDGVGYGSDGIPWGGECILGDLESFQRLGHLEEFGLPGGDSSVYHPERIAHWLTHESGRDLDIGDSRLSKILEKTHSTALRTTSMGRLLDALSALLLGTTRRTYDGEPAMRIETLLRRSGNPRTDLFRMDKKPGAVIERWNILIGELFGDENDVVMNPDLELSRKADLAMGLIGSVIDDMIRIVMDKTVTAGSTDENGDVVIGITGGVAYNIPVVNYFIETCRSEGARPIVHSRIPSGDGGVSAGQAVIGGKLLDSM